MSADEPFLAPTYARLPVTFERGEGVWLWDKDGRRYLDAVAGVAVCGLGHAHPAVAQALCAQAERLVHTSNLYRIELQEKLAAALAGLSGLDTAFFCNSGTEATEAAIKFARLSGRAGGLDEPVIAVTEGAFHGRTLGAWSATASSDNNVFAPLIPGFARVPFADIAALEELADRTPALCAVMFEPIQGENGICIAPGDYLRAVRRLCDERGLLMILDEVQTGVGRTGAWYCFQHHGLTPDLVTTAKALGNGVPIGACLLKQSIAEPLQPGMHGSTFGGNPLACAAALAVIKTIERENLCARAADIGTYLLDSLRRELRSKMIVEIRGRGLMIGIELDRPCKPLVRDALARGLLINVTAERVIRLVPPLILETGQADMIVERLGEILSGFEAAQ